MSFVWLPVYRALTAGISYDYEWISCQRGLQKPDEAAYSDLMHMIGNDRKVLFIDDRRNNCESAKRFGWDVIHYYGMDASTLRSKILEWL